MGCCISTCCCEHNFIIFPAPRAHGGWDFEKQIIKTNGPTIEVDLKKDFFNDVFLLQPKDGQKVPYIQISNEASRKKQQAIIYFHGNAQDIFHAIDFTLPIFKANEITIFCLEYPTYSCYQTDKNYFISNRIKSDSVKFHNHLQTQYKINPENIYIIGRSIGSGPASYLASQVHCRKLMLISPFDSIRKVSVGLVGCVGYAVKNHFSNEESILTHEGELLVIHGQRDEVINFSHGKALVEVYEITKKKKARFIQPTLMSHNGFNMEADIVKPITDFLNNKQITQNY